MTKKKEVKAVYLMSPCNELRTTKANVFRMQSKGTGATKSSVLKQIKMIENTEHSFRVQNVFASCLCLVSI